MLTFKAVDEFLKRLDWSSSDARNWNMAVKFLMARKFNVDRAVKLYEEHENLRKKEGLNYIDLGDEDFITDLETGKFTILPFVKNQPVCALFTVRLHTGTGAPNSELITLKTLVYQLDAALENSDAQKNGINFIYDMNNCKRANYDLSLSQKILTLVRGSYPARLNKLFVVAAPFWFKCFVKVLSILMREKLRERVLFVTNEELRNQVPVEILPDNLGGLVKLNHPAWLAECEKLVSNRASTCHCYYFNSKRQNGINGINHTNGDANQTDNINNQDPMSNRKRPLSDFIDVEDKKAKISTMNGNETRQVQSSAVDDQLLTNKIAPVPFEDFYESIQNVDPSNDDGMTLDDLVEHVRQVNSYGLSEEFKNIRSQPIYSTINSFKLKENKYKNRYGDVFCLDNSRVKLVAENGNDASNRPNGKSKSNGDDNDDDLSEEDEYEDDEIDTNRNDYIHANYVDGYKQSKGYISTQGPLDNTIADFWQMIWQQYVLVIAMTTKVFEQRKIKCAQYWPLEKGATIQVENQFEIVNTNVEDLEDYRVSHLTIKHIPSQLSRQIVHCQFLSWPDHGVPKSAIHILEFIDLVRKNQVECLKKLNADPKQKWNGHPLGPPICVHCSAGIGRTGTFCAIDISINRLKDCKTVQVEDTVNKIRLQRAQSVQMRDQYVFCYQAIIEYAKRYNLLSDSNVDVEKLFSDMF